MLNQRQWSLYDAFYESTHKNEFLDQKTEVLVGLTTAIDMNCKPCTKHYLNQAKQVGAEQGEVSEVLAKVIAVATGQKRLQMQEILEE